ncbi:unnamed protein product [Symbiodinium sp. CCMP2592]|nr:unnamed protein product [Symbiodinium sp. CCMP2592]
MAVILLMLNLVTKNEFGKTSFVKGERAEDEGLGNPLLDGWDTTQNVEHSINQEYKIAPSSWRSSWIQSTMTRTMDLIKEIQKNRAIKAIYHLVEIDLSVAMLNPDVEQNHPRLLQLQQDIFQFNFLMLNVDRGQENESKSVDMSTDDVLEPETPSWNRLFDRSDRSGSISVSF